MQFDLAVFRAIHTGWHSPVADVVFLVLSWLGLGVLQAVLAFVFLCWRQTRAYVAPIVISVLVSGLLVAQVLKALIPRQRPSNLNFSLPQENWLYNSFPSGHTTTSFACATMIVLLVPKQDRRWVGPLSFVLATGVGISRIYRGVHWPTDVIGGICAGISSAIFVHLLWQTMGYGRKGDQIVATSI